MNLTPQAIGWSATMGLFPGYGHDNAPELRTERVELLKDAWNREMDACRAATRFSVSCVMTDATVLYPRDGGCPEGGEDSIMLTGSSNPKFVRTDELEAFMDAVVEVVQAVQKTMEQTSCRIEFTPILRSIYSRETLANASPSQVGKPDPDRTPPAPTDCGQCDGTGTIEGGLGGDGEDEECPVCNGLGVLPNPRD
jgi:hypothetical protein